MLSPSMRYWTMQALGADEMETVPVKDVPLMVALALGAVIEMDGCAQSGALAKSKTSTRGMKFMGPGVANAAVQNISISEVASATLEEFK
jgi:hypothetical protein